MKAITLKESPSFGLIQSFFPNKEGKRLNFEYNGIQIFAERKIILKHNSISSAYLHIRFKDHHNNVHHYRETKAGTFRLI